MMEHDALTAYYEQIQGAYDQIASEYDATVGMYAVSARAKRLAIDIIRAVTPLNGRLLDVGCYTGVEALALARAGYHVLGVDLSPKMVSLARTKAKQSRLETLVRFMTGRACELQLLQSDPLAPFDTVYSVYGTLNLEPQISRFKEGLLHCLKDGGAFVCGLLNPTVLYELLIAPFLLKFHGYRKLSKHGISTRIGLGDARVRTYLYTPSEFARLMSPEFSLEDARGLHIFYPPPRPRPRGRTDRWWVARAFDSLETRLERRLPFSSLGFFSLLVFRRGRGW
jgi:ubiquinone/menaquinone biosynthesis C-methylase UbiE